MATTHIVAPYRGPAQTNPAPPIRYNTTHVVFAPVSTGLAALIIPITSPASKHTNEAPQTATLTRPGRKPFFYWTGPNLRATDLTFTIWNQNRTSVEASIATLRNLVNVQVRVLNYGQMMTGTWWISTLEIDPVQRVEGSNAVFWADTTVTLTEASDDDVAGPTTVLSRP